MTAIYQPKGKQKKTISNLGSTEVQAQTSVLLTCITKIPPIPVVTLSPQPQPNTYLLCQRQEQHRDENTPEWLNVLSLWPFKTNGVA